MKLYIGNIPEEVEEKELKSLFDSYKSLVSTTIVKDKNSGVSRGFAFVEFKDNKDGQNAMEKFNEYELHGRAIKVSEANVKSKRPQRASGLF